MKPIEITGENIRTIKSKYSFDETIKRLSETITAKGMTIFATINHTEAAQKAGLTMQPAVVLIFGNPKAGTPLMQKDPLFALQLPLKVLITEVNGEVLVSFTKTKSLVKGSNIPYSDVENTLAKVEGLIVGSVEE